MIGTGLEDSLGGLSFLRRYGSRLTAAAFPALATTGGKRRTTCREILLFGDSHSWGQGSADYDGRAHYSTHMSFPYSKGYYARLEAHARERLAFNAELRFPDGGGAKSELGLTVPVRGTGLYGPAAYRDRAREHLGYLAERQAFGPAIWTIERKSGIGGEAVTEEQEFRFPLRGHASMLFVGVVADPDGAVLEAGLEAPYYYAAPPGYPKLYLVEAGMLKALDAPGAGKGAASPRSLSIRTRRSPRSGRTRSISA